MTEVHAERYIRIERSNTRSVEDQVAISHAMWDANIGPEHPGLKKDAVEDRLQLDLEYSVETSLKHLEEIDAIEGVVPAGPDFFAISERRDDIVNGEVEDVAAADIEALIDHIQDDDPVGDEPEGAVADGGGPTVRTVVADVFDVIPESLEQFLREGDQVDKLRTAVEAIEADEHVDTRDDYGTIVFRRAAHKFRLTAAHVNRYEREEGPEVFADD